MLFRSLIVPVMALHSLASTAPRAVATPAGRVDRPCTRSARAPHLHQVVQWHYAGPYANQVRYLLSRVDGWSVATDDLRTPTIDFDMSCSRDQSVAAAITKAFGAEAYATQGDTDKAEEWATSMHQELEQVNRLCSDASTAAERTECATVEYWPCPAPF